MLAGIKMFTWLLVDLVMHLLTFVLGGLAWLFCGCLVGLAKLVVAGCDALCDLCG